MLALWNSFLDWLRSLFWKREMSFSIIGPHRAGKTTLVEVLASGHYNEEIAPTLGVTLRKVSKGNVTIKIWDIGGQDRFQGMWARYCRGVSVVVYVVDAADHESIEHATKLLHDVMKRPNMRSVPLLVLGNKNDLPHALGTHELKDRMQLDALDCQEVAIYSISCKSQTNIQLVLEWLIKHSTSKRTT